MLTCRICGEEKEKSLFSIRKETGRYRTECTPCRSRASTALRYGVSVGDIEALAVKQEHRCAICGTHKRDIPHLSFKHSPLVLDHDHKTGRVRGLLCPTCNAGLGHFKDSPKLLAQAAAYLA